MDNQTRQVLKGYFSLKSEQRKEIADLIAREQRGGLLEEQQIIKNSSISMGPSGSGCPCCGR